MAHMILVLRIGVAKLLLSCSCCSSQLYNCSTAGHGTEALARTGQASAIQMGVMRRLALRTKGEFHPRIVQTVTSPS